MTSYNFWIQQARRYDKTVNFGSPMTAWTSAMFKEYDKAKEEKRLPNMKNCTK